MADKTAIQWADSTWNPTVGCSIVSPGCTNCYAMKTAHSLETRFGSKKYGALTKVANGNPVWTGEVRLDEGALLQPLKWKRPRRIFVNSMSDLFHEKLTDEQIDRVFAVMALCPQHTFQVLTKRAERMRDYVTRHNVGARWAMEVRGHMVSVAPQTAVDWTRHGLPNVWLGVSCERQQEADERIPLLLQTPAAVRFISAEPLLGPIDLWEVQGAIRCCGTDTCATVAQPPELCEVYSNIDWLIVGGESGANARPMHPAWARSIRDQCQAAGVSFFFKQVGEWAWQGEHNRYAVIGPDGIMLKANQQLIENPPKAGRLLVTRVGKKAAGRLLDGREHNEFPSSAT